MLVDFRPSDPARHIETEEDIFHYLEAAMEGNDPKHIARALGDVARSKGMTEIAKKTGLGRQAKPTVTHSLSRRQHDAHIADDPSSKKMPK
jgi:probable addiction module antidote protein